MPSPKNLLVTGGAGFIGSSFIRYTLAKSSFRSRLINFDALTYAGKCENIGSWQKDPRYRFVHADIRNQSLVEDLLHEEKIDTIVHFAAETHVDRSIALSLPFIETNVLGTLALLEAVRKFPHIHFHHISTDEVYGALPETGAFHELSPYRPNSPYAASKASSDHLVRAFAHTYQLRTTLSHCGNNYGPNQFPEKFVPLMISRCLDDLPLPIYGTGMQVRDWIYVDDHVEALWLILEKGRIGEVYDIGGRVQLSNLAMLEVLMEIVAEETGREISALRALIRFVEDRPGHDFRYAIDPSKIEKEFGWRPKTPLKEGLRKTVGAIRSGKAQSAPLQG